MALLSVHNVSKYFGEACLFRGVSFEIGARDKVGLVGDNGSGKTTLLRILTGGAAADEGAVVPSRGLRLAYMEQYACTDEGRTLWDEAEAVFAPLAAMERELAAVNTRLAGGSGDPALIERQHRLTEEFADAGGLTYKSRVRSTLAGLGFGEDMFSRPMSTLSGGQRSKAAMGRLLLSEADLLLLDEPTNHLDIPSVEWLEDTLRGYGGAVVVISHDRYFLDRVTGRTLELANKRLYLTDGNYSVHRARRDKDRETEEKHYKTSMREVQRMEEMIARFKSFNREKSIRAAESKQKRLDRMLEDLQKPESAAPVIRFDFSVETTGGNEVLTAEELAMGFDGPDLFRHVSFRLMRGDRVFLLGPNGCGKTTLLRVLTGQLTPRAGEARLGAKVAIGYYDQEQSGLDDEKTAMEEVWDAYPDRTPGEIRNAMAAFLFRGDDVFKPVRLLSGGERARLLLLKLMMARDNFLLLDEPTNHLDIASREALERALEGYDGTLLAVSHDRYFINRMASRVMWLAAGGCRLYDGDYDTYLARREAPEEAAAAPPPRVNEYRQRKERESAVRRLEGAIRRCEEAVASAEEALAALTRELEQAGADYARVMELTAALEEGQAALDARMAEWETLHAELENLTNE